MRRPGQRCRYALQQGGEDLGLGAEQVDRVVPAMRQLEQLLEEVDAGDPFRQRAAQQAARPDDGLAVGQQQVAGEQGVAQHAVAVQVDDLGGVEHAEDQRPARPHGLLAAADHFGHAQAVEMQAEQQLPGGRRRRDPNH